MRIVILISILLLQRAFVTAQTVTGTIVDQLGIGLSDLHATLYTPLTEYTTTTDANGSFSFPNVTSVNDKSVSQTGYSISNNYPNPFNPKTRIGVTLRNNSKVRIDIYNVLGQMVMGDMEKYLRAGDSYFDLELKGLPSGFYIARISVDDQYVATRKMMLIYGSQHLAASDPDQGYRSDRSTLDRRSTMDTKLDSLVLTGISIERTVFAPLPTVTGNVLNLGSLVITVPAPNAPTLLSPPDSATDQSTSPTLTWNASSGATSYGSQVSTTSMFTSFVRKQSGLTSTGAAVGGLDTSTQHYWRVNATNSYGTSQWSDTWSFTTSGTIGDQLFIFQGAYDALGTLDEIAQLAARHDVVVFTHGFYLDGSTWVHGNCLDVDYSKMPDLLVKVREKNPRVKIFVYVSATADHPNGCWPQPSVQMSECPNGNCADFKTWTNLWLNLEHDHNGIIIDGIFVDLVHPALIGTAVRDSVFSYVKSRGKLLMANVLSDTLGLKFAASSPFLQPEDFLLIEGYCVLAGNPNVQTGAMNLQLQNMNIHWAALASEWYNSALTCNSDNMKNAYAMFRQYGGSAFAYQSADLGTQSGTWVYCPHGRK